MRKLSVLVLSIFLLSSCSEVVGFGVASANLFFALLKIGGILLLIGLVIAFIASFFE